MLQEKLQTILKVVGVILIFCIFGVGILLLDRVLTPKKSAAETFESVRTQLMSAELDGVKYMRKNVETYMIVGLDKKQEAIKVDRFTNNTQADFILLLVVDKSSRQISAINVNRDTMAVMDVLGLTGRTVNTLEPVNSIELPVTMAHTYGDGKEESAENVRRAVSRLFSSATNGKETKLEVKIDHYLTMTMDAVSAFNDYLGGVTVTLNEDEDLSDETHPDWTPGATISLTGEDALWFIRDRNTDMDGSNAERMGRQNRYVEALAKSISGKKWSRKYLIGAYDAIGKYTCTDQSNVDDFYDDLLSMFDAFGLFPYNKIVKLAPAEKEGDVSYGHYEDFDYYGRTVDSFHIKTAEEKAAVQQLVIDTFYRRMDEKEKK